MQIKGINLNYLAASIILTSIIAVIAGLITWQVYQTLQEWQTIREAWHNIEIFEKRLLYTGALLIILTPALKEAKFDLYAIKIILEIIPPLAGSFLVAGTISFMRKVHELKSKEGN